MLRLAACIMTACVLTGCATQEATSRYLKATQELNTCLLANAGVAGACSAQRQVLANDRQVYDDVAGP